MIRFGTDGWRAVISEDFTFDNVRRVAQAIAGYLKNHKLSSRELIIGYDSRFLSEKFAEEVVRVMMENGIKCLIAEEDIPTPVAAFSVKDRRAAGAVMITASHNPPEYNGIKFIPDYAGPASLEITEEIEGYLKSEILNPKSEMVRQAHHPEQSRGMVRQAHHPERSRRTNSKSKTQKASLERFHPAQRYFKHLETLIDKETIKRAKLRVVYDPMYGSGRRYLDKLLEDFGCRLQVLHGYRDVLFGGGRPEPVEGNLLELREAVKASKADLGLASDGDADRFGAVDDHGNFIDTNYALALVLEHLLEKGLSGGVARSVATTQMLDRIADKHDLRVYETPVGFKYIAELMRRENILFGGEESGGLTIKGHVPEKDGILAGLLITEMAAAKKKPLSEIKADLESKYGRLIFRRVNLHLREEIKSKLMEEVKSRSQNIFGFKVEKINTLDGLKFIFKDKSSLLVRPSGTEPLIRVYIESDGEEKILNLEKGLEKLVEQTDVK